MPQIANLTLGSAVSIAASADTVFRAVPTPPGRMTKDWESSHDGAPDLATRISASTLRRNSRVQSSMLRINAPIVREVSNVQTPVATASVQTTAVFPPQMTSAEKEKLLDLHIKALKSTFFGSVFINGESMN